MIDFSKPYNREDFLTFLEDDLLPNDFEICEKEIPLSGFQQRFVSSVTKLGTCKSLGLDVFEMKHQSLHDARVGISKDAFQIILHKSLNNRALVIFLPHQNNEQYRFSLIQIETSIEDDKLRRSYSNPRRYSYILGKGTPTTTPTQFLGKGRIRATEKNSLFDDLQNRFSVEVLTKQFYNELFEWYQWALSPQMGITYPNNTDILSDDRHKIEEHLIRLITRIMFVWFIKQKKLVPDNLFEIDFLKSILKDFDPQSRIVGNYYNAILQNLFFATLNKEIGKRDFAYDEDDRNMRKEHYGIKTLYRYKEMFSISDNEIVKLFQSVPFLNGGLFECLDKEKDADTDLIIYYDGFSRNKDFFPNTQTYKCRAFIPNQLFFDEQKGLIPLLAKYNFTVEENSPNDADVALDPELLGKVFENLLGAYNPETKETARNQSGSFYTPREIVDYMVNESLIAYTESSCSNSPNNIPKDIFRELFTKEDLPEFLVNSHEYCELIANKLRSAKILDPACGSGAFPMGILNKMVRVLEKLDCRKEKTVYAQKLHLIENCIYGVDIQNIAVQISKLRFFISLICEQEKDETKPNYGIPTLPNLETKFVAANTLIDIKKRPAQGNLFEDPEIEITQKELLAVRKQHFSAINAQQKAECRFKDKQLREKLAKLLADNEEYSPDDAIQMAHWNPYDQNATSLFFDAEWMFGVNTGFDIVIGNPPYISTKGVKEDDKKALEKEFGFADDTYNHFFFKGKQLLNTNGNLTFITPKTFWTTQTKRNLRDLLLDNKINYFFDTANPFEAAMVDACITSFTNKTVKNNEIRFLDGSKDLSNPFKYFVSQEVYRNTQNSVIFKPTPENMRIYEKYGQKVKELYDKWWDKIKTSRDIEKNKEELEAYRKSLKPGDVALLGCLTEGGQGLATANNGKYIAVRKSTKWAKNILESRSKKLVEAIQKKKIQVQGLEQFANVTDFLTSLSEIEIAKLFDDLKEKYGRDIFGQGYIYRLIDDNEVANVNELTQDEKDNGIDTSKKYYVPYDKGDKDGNRWYLETPFAIAWSKENVRFLKTNSGKKGEGMPVVRNPQFYFREGLCWNDINTTFLKCRLKGKSINDVKSMSLFPLCDFVPISFIVCVINSTFISYYVDNYVNNTQTFQINDARQLPIVIPTKETLISYNRIFDEAYAVKQELFCNSVNINEDEQKLNSIQKRIDKMVIQLYGLE